MSVHPGRSRPRGHGGTRCRRNSTRWDDARFRAAGFRAVPGCVVRRSAYIAPGVVLMPSFVNLGAYVDAGTMIDTWATVGSCAQIGKNCHISGGAGIGGVLEPLQAGPVIIEDNCFIGARSEVAEGVIVREGSVLSMGVFIGASTKIVDRDSGESFQSARCRPIRWWCRAPCPARPARTAGRPEPLLRRHRQARRRKDPRQDQHQRTAAGLTRVAPMDWAYLLNSFQGRIGRQTFWIAMVRRRHRRRARLPASRRSSAASGSAPSSISPSPIRNSPSAPSAAMTAICRSGCSAFSSPPMPCSTCSPCSAVAGTDEAPSMLSLGDRGAVHGARPRAACRARLSPRHGRPEPVRAGPVGEELTGFQDPPPSSIERVARGFEHGIVRDHAEQHAAIGLQIATIELAARRGVARDAQTMAAMKSVDHGRQDRFSRTALRSYLFVAVRGMAGTKNIAARPLERRERRRQAVSVEPCGQPLSNASGAMSVVVSGESAIRNEV